MTETKVDPPCRGPLLLAATVYFSINVCVRVYVCVRARVLIGLAIHLKGISSVFLCIFKLFQTPLSTFTQKRSLDPPHASPLSQTRYAQYVDSLQQQTSIFMVLQTLQRRKNAHFLTSAAKRNSSFCPYFHNILVKRGDFILLN